MNELSTTIGQAEQSIELRVERGDGVRVARSALFVARWWAVTLFLAIGLLFTVNPPYNIGPPIRSDGFGYHAWTRALLDGNVSFCPYVDLTHVGALQPASEIGRCANKYPPGLALLRFPFMAPFAATNGGALRSDAEDLINQLLALTAAAVAMAAAIATSVRLKAPRWIANFGALAMMFGTNQFHYATFDSSFTHIYTASLVGVLMFLVVRAGTESRAIRPSETLLVAATVGFLIDIRLMLIAPLAVVALGLLVLECMSTSVGTCWAKHRRMILAATAGASLAIAQQLLYNRYIFGKWTISSYVGEEFVWSQFKQLHVLFSTRRGVFLWSPMMALTIAAIAYTRQRTMLVSVLLATSTLTVIYGAWEFWDLAGGFGHRGFVEVTPLFATGLAVAFARLEQRLRVLGYVACGGLTLMTLGLMRGYWSRELGFYGATSDEYVRFTIGSRSLLVHYVRELLGLLGV